MKTDKSRSLINGEWINNEKFTINFIDGSSQDYIVDPRAVPRIKREIIDTSSPVFEVANCIYYKDKIKSFQF
jgi:hypothetical protein